jgi:hypothetical protein
MKKHRIITIVLSIINLILALYLLVEFQVLKIGPDFGLERISKTQLNSMHLYANIQNYFLRFLFVLSILVVIAVPAKRNWGRVLALLQCVLFAVFGIYVLQDIFRYFSYWDILSCVVTIQDFWVGIFCIVFSLTEWIYLTRPNVKALFKPVHSQAH